MMCQLYFFQLIQYDILFLFYFLVKSTFHKVYFEVKFALNKCTIWSKTLPFGKNKIKKQKSNLRFFYALYSLMNTYPLSLSHYLQLAEFT